MSALREEYDRRRAEPSDIRDHLDEIYRTASSYAQPRILELGVRSGNSTAALLAAAEMTGGHVWSVDVAQPTVPDWWLTTGRWTLHVGNDVDGILHHRLKADPGVFDVLFIDTVHTYQHTLAELRLYVPMVRPGGTVLLHDTELHTPAGLPADVVNSQPAFPVAAALNMFCTETGAYWENRPGCYGLGVMKVGFKH